MFQSLIIYDTGSEEKKKFSQKGEERLSLRQLSGNFPDRIAAGIEEHPIAFTEIIGIKSGFRMEVTTSLTAFPKVLVSEAEKPDQKGTEGIVSLILQHKAQRGKWQGKV